MIKRCIKYQKLKLARIFEKPKTQDPIEAYHHFQPQKPHLKKRGNVIISITGKTESYLAKESNYVLPCYVEQEACPNNLAPTSSTTSQMALGDALAVSLLELRGFKTEDFASHHPGGSLGKKLNLTLKDLASKNPIPKVKEKSKINDVIKEITSNRLGITLVIKKDKLYATLVDL